MAGSFFAMRVSSFSMRACSGSTSGFGSAASCSAVRAFGVGRLLGHVLDLQLLRLRTVAAEDQPDHPDDQERPEHHRDHPREREHRLALAGLLGDLGRLDGAGGAERQAGQGDEVAAVGVEAGGGGDQLADRVGLGRIGDDLAVEGDGDVQPLDRAGGADGLLDGPGQLVVGGDVALLVLGGAGLAVAGGGVARDVASAAPGTPPAAAVPCAPDSEISRRLRTCGAFWLGEKVSAFDSYWSQSRSALTRTTALSGPTSGISIVFTSSVRRCSRVRWTSARVFCLLGRVGLGAALRRGRCRWCP